MRFEALSASMFGSGIIVRSLSRTKIEDSFGNLWQYHSRSDRHSKIACWAMLLDLLRSCPLLIDQINRGTVGFGINHEMRDFKSGRRKNLDLVICTPGSPCGGSATTFAGLAVDYGIELSKVERLVLGALPDVHRVPVGSVHLALEAKACMTAHIKALPRLYDELNSSHAAIHGSTDFAIAVGFAMVNLADSFVSPDRNRRNLRRRKPVVNDHVQPGDTVRTIEKLKEIPRRTQTNTEGYDALGVLVVRMANDGSPMTLVNNPPAPADSDPWHYDQMIRRMASLYASKFGNV